MTIYQPYPYPYQPQYAPPVKPHHGMAVAALTCGIVGTVVGIIPILAVPALALGLLALTFGLIGHRHKSGKAGAVLGVIAVLLGILGMTIVTNAANHLDRCVNATTVSQQQTSCR